MIDLRLKTTRKKFANTLDELLQDELLQYAPCYPFLSEPVKISDECSFEYPKYGFDGHEINLEEDLMAQASTGCYFEEEYHAVAHLSKIVILTYAREESTNMIYGKVLYARERLVKFHFLPVRSDEVVISCEYYDDPAFNKIVTDAIIYAWPEARAQLSSYIKDIKGIKTPTALKTATFKPAIRQGDLERQAVIWQAVEPLAKAGYSIPSIFCQYSNMSTAKDYPVSSEKTMRNIVKCGRAGYYNDNRANQDIV